MLGCCMLLLLAASYDAAYYVSYGGEAQKAAGCCVHPKGHLPSRRGGASPSEGAWLAPTEPREEVRARRRIFPLGALRTAARPCARAAWLQLGPSGRRLSSITRGGELQPVAPRASPAPSLKRPSGPFSQQPLLLVHPRARRPPLLLGASCCLLGWLVCYVSSYVLLRPSGLLAG